MDEIVKYELDSDLIYKYFRIDKNEFRLNPSKKFSILPYNTVSIASDAKDIMSIQTSVFKKASGLSYPLHNNEDAVLESICEKVDSSYKQELKGIIKSMYFKEGELVKFHPILFNYGGKEKAAVGNIGNYVIEHLFDEDIRRKLRDVLNYNTDNILETLILEALPICTETDNLIGANDFSIIPEVKTMFKHDFMYICSNYKLFIENAQKLIEFYIFLLCSQTILMLKNGFKNSRKMKEVYYFVDWEQISKSRLGYKQGWRMIEKKSESIFAYVNLLQTLNMTKDATYKGDFDSIKQKIECLDEAALLELKNVLYSFNLKIRELLELPAVDTKTQIFSPYDFIDDLLATFIQAKDDQGKTGRSAAYDRYEKNIKEIANIGFLKPRGQLGSTLNLNEEWIVFLTRLCIGEHKKIRLNDLWTEMELRGIYFDKYTRENIVVYFEKINILEKKSDSGDAQYVRVL